jgi:hypothetical protein
MNVLGEGRIGKDITLEFNSTMARVGKIFVLLFGRIIQGIYRRELAGGRCIYIYPLEFVR